VLGIASLVLGIIIIVKTYKYLNSKTKTNKSRQK